MPSPHRMGFPGKPRRRCGADGPLWPLRDRRPARSSGGTWGPRRRRGGILSSRRNTGKNRSGRSRPAPLLLDQGKGQYGFNANLLAQKSASRSLISKAQINVPGGFFFPFSVFFFPSILKESKNREKKKKKKKRQTLRGEDNMGLYECFIGNCCITF